jgi:hypothetical protein
MLLRALNLRSDPAAALTSLAVSVSEYARKSINLASDLIKPRAREGAKQ